MVGNQERHAKGYLVEFEPDSPRHILLGDIDGSLESFPLRAEPETIVYQLSIPAMPEKVRITGWPREFLHYFCNVNLTSVYLVGKIIHTCCLVDKENRMTGGPACKFTSFE